MEAAAAGTAVERLESKLHELQEEHSEHADGIHRLSSENEQLLEAHERLKDEHEKLRQEYSKLQTEYNEWIELIEQA